MCKCWGFLDLQRVNFAFSAYFVAKGLVLSNITLPRKFFFVKVASIADVGKTEMIVNLQLVKGCAISKLLPVPHPMSANRDEDDP